MLAQLSVSWWPSSESRCPPSSIRSLRSASSLSVANCPSRGKTPDERVTAAVIPTQVLLSPSASRAQGHVRRSIGRHLAKFRRLTRAHVAHGSCCNRRVIQPTTVGPPAVPINTRSCPVPVRARFRCHPTQPRPGARTGKVTLELKDLQLQLSSRPGQVA